MVLLNTLSFCVILKRCLVNAYVCVPPQVTPLPGPTADSHMLCVQRCAWSCYEYITVADDIFVKCCQYNLNVIYIYIYADIQQILWQHKLHEMHVVDICVYMRCCFVMYL